MVALAIVREQVDRSAWLMPSARAVTSMSRCAELGWAGNPAAMPMCRRATISCLLMWLHLPGSAPSSAACAATTFGRNLPFTGTCLDRATGTKTWCEQRGGIQRRPEPRPQLGGAAPSARLSVREQGEPGWSYELRFEPVVKAWQRSNLQTLVHTDIPRPC